MKEIPMDSETSRNNKATQLVACFVHHPSSHNASYYFDYFKIQDLLDYKTFPRLLLRPTRSLPWPDPESEEKNNNFTNHVRVSFLHSSSHNDDDDGPGVLYAVGGVNSSHFRGLQQIPESLPNVFTRISLSRRSMLEDVDNTHMNAGKLFPLVVEIDHRIYVLSAPVNIFHPCRNVIYYSNTFEVYNPRDKSWKVLSDLPFINYYKYKPPNYLGLYKYSYLVLGQKLFVSDNVLSSVYDIESNTWSACHLFSDCPQIDNDRHCRPFLPRPVSLFYTGEAVPPPSLPSNCGPGFPFYTGEAVPPPSLPSNCGPGFPFIGQGLLWKGKFLLCMKPGSVDPPMAAYRIEEDKAQPLELRYQGKLVPYGTALQLVDIGDDHFAFINYTTKEVLKDTMNIFTFKLETDATNKNCLIVKYLKKRYSKPHGIGHGLLAYSFTC